MFLKNLDQYFQLVLNFKIIEEWFTGPAFLRQKNSKNRSKIHIREL